VFQIQLRSVPEAERAVAAARLRAWCEERGARLLGGDGAAAGMLYLEGPAALATALAARPEVRAVSPCDSPAGARLDAQAAFAVRGARFGGGPFAVVAGPCAVEEGVDLPTHARELARAGACALRGGAFKPRSSPHVFQGLGAAGLEALAAARAASGLPVITELLDPRDLPLLLEHADVLQIGSRNMHNGALLREAGRAGLPVLLKRGMSATLDEFLHAAEFVASGGCTRIVLCERGLRHFDPAVRNLLDLSAVPALQQRTRLPVLVDPSHGTGRAALVPAMMAAAAAAGADGLLDEVHPHPAAALCDAAQALDLPAFRAAMETVGAVLRALGRDLARAPVGAAAATA
jgi:3-deoxy-7-phosphoheptulonate synthase